MIDIETAYRKSCETPSDIYEHLPFLHEVANGKQVVELGVRSGESSKAFLAGGAQLWSVDIGAQPFSHPNWTFMQGDDRDPAVASRAPNCDVLFIDSSHGYEHTLFELWVYGAKVRNGGLIVLHDTELETPAGEEAGPAFPVKKALEEYSQEQDYSYFLRPYCWGLGVITVDLTGRV